MAGLAGGWLGAGELLRRFRVRPPRSRAAIALVGIPSLTVLTLLAMGMLPGILGLLTEDPGWSGSDALYPAARWYAAPTGTVAGLLGLIATAALAAGRIRIRPDVVRPALTAETYPLRYASRTVAALHLFFFAGWASVVLVYLTVIGGDREGMLAMEYDPKEIVSGPLVVLWVVLYLACLLGSVLNPWLLALSVPMLARGRAAVGARTWSCLLVSAALVIVTPVAWLTGFQSDLNTWLLD